ncbi:MAG: peroxiredoxin family protein [Deltaproteobacteria bacterium]|nr:peroxiredoxin family protein [Deltaproteobacteria bacterium]
MEQKVRKLNTARKPFHSYQILIHGLLIALAVTVFGLVRENRELRKPSILENASIEEGEVFPAFPAFDLKGESRLVDLTESKRGSLVFVLNTLCPACRENQASWRTLYEQEKDRYEILGISLDDIDSTAKYRQANDLPFSLVVPKDIPDFTTTHKIDRIPLTLQIDHNGEVHSSWLGVLTDDSLAQLTASLAAES